MLSITMLSGMGYYAAVGGQAYSNPAGGDVNRLIDTLSDQQGTDTGTGLLDSFTVGGANALQIFWIVISDTSELVMLFFPIPAVANAVETLAQIAFGLMFLMFVRGVVV